MNKTKEAAQYSTGPRVLLISRCLPKGIKDTRGAPNHIARRIPTVRGAAGFHKMSVNQHPQAINCKPPGSCP